MQAFFWLAPQVERNAASYRDSVITMCRQVGMTPVFNDQRPPDQRPIEWLSEQLNSSDFAFFDLTAADPDALIAFGLSTECEAQCFALRDPDVLPVVEPSLAGVITNYFEPEDFQRKARAIITAAKGASAINQRQLMEKIKGKLLKLGPLPMRGIARELGYHPNDIKAVVYSMVSENSIKKLSDKRWTHYSA